jgi:hypothetical protein
MQAVAGLFKAMAYVFSADVQRATSSAVRVP